MKYSQLNTQYKYDVIAGAVYARELEHFHYDFDRANFEHLIATLPDGDCKNDIAKRHADTLAQMANVEAIHAALMAQIDDSEEYRLAVQRVTAKREEQACDTQK